MTTTFTTAGAPWTTTCTVARPSSGRVFWNPTAALLVALAVVKASDAIWGKASNPLRKASRVFATEETPAPLVRVTGGPHSKAKDASKGFEKLAVQADALGDGKATADEWTRWFNQVMLWMRMAVRGYVIQDWNNALRVEAGPGHAGYFKASAEWFRGMAKKIKETDLSPTWVGNGPI
jgi:hypothetical protein